MLEDPLVAGGQDPVPAALRLRLDPGHAVPGRQQIGEESNRQVLQLLGGVPLQVLVAGDSIPRNDVGPGAGTAMRPGRISCSSSRMVCSRGNLDKPNRLVFSPDERSLYVADTGVSHRPGGPHHIVAFDVVEGSRLANRRVFAEIIPGVADGFRVDTEGNIWTSAGDGVHCYAPDGELIGKIHFPEVITNLAFGGRKRNRLFATGGSAVYALFVGQSGAQRP